MVDAHPPNLAHSERSGSGPGRDVFYGFAAIPVEEPEPEAAPDTVRMLAAPGSEEEEQLSRIIQALASDDDDEDEDLFGEDDLDDDDDLYEDEDDEDDKPD